MKTLEEIKSEMILERERVNKEVKEVIKEIKLQQEYLVKDKREEELMGFYEDCGEFYRNIVIEREEGISDLIKKKIRLEKYKKKLKHQIEEWFN